MSVAYFSNPARVEDLLKSAAAWKGTPFAERQAVMGAGVDCVHLANAILADGCGWPHDFCPPIYRMEDTMHRSDSALIAYLDDVPNLDKSVGTAEEAKAWINKDHLMPGDLLVFQLGRGPHHCGIMLKWPFFIHTLRGLRCHISQLNDPTYGNRFRGFYRPIQS